MESYFEDLFSSSDLGKESDPSLLIY